MGVTEAESPGIPPSSKIAPTEGVGCMVVFGGSRSGSPMSLLESSRSTDVAQNFVHDADKWLCCIDDDATARYVFFRSMQSRNEFLFLWFSTPVSWVARHTLI